MEITKLRLQLSTALGRVAVHLLQVRCKFRKLTRIAAETARKLGRELRTRGNALRVLLVAKSREAIIAAHSKVSKAKARLASAFDKGTAHLRQAQNRLIRLKGSVTEKLQKQAEERRARAEERRARKDELRAQAAKAREAAVEAKVDRKVTKVKAQPLIAPGQWTAHLLQAQNPLAGLARSVAEKSQQPPEELRARKEGLRVPEASPREAVVEVDRKITKARAHSPIASEQWTAPLGQVQNPLSGLTKSVSEKVQKPPEELRAREEGLRVPEAKPREAIVAEGSAITKVKARLSAAFEQRTARLRQAPKALAGLGRNIVGKRRKRRQELGARESQMRELLANSPDAIAVIDGDHCFVTANRRALDLFGISERNLSEFNIDAFLFRGQIRDLRQNGSSFMGRQERHGKCLIRRLDGSLQVAEFAFVTDFLPLQHLCRFYDLCMPRPTPVQHRIPPGTQHSSHVGQAH